MGKQLPFLVYADAAASGNLKYATNAVLLPSSK